MNWYLMFGYEFEIGKKGPTGWYRCPGGRLVNGLWPEWNNQTGEKRYG